VLERAHHGVHDRLRVALEAGNEQIALAAERGVQSVAARAGAPDQLVEPGGSVPVTPEQLHGAVQGLRGLERFGPWHAPPVSRTRSLICQCALAEAAYTGAR